MRLVALTGGIASGKSTVAALLAGRGAIVIDADAIAREIVEPGQPAWRAVVDRFGASIVRSDRTLDRDALAAIVFADEGARRDLETITHPEVLRVIAERIAEHAESDRVVIVDVPLLVETGKAGTFDTVLVVAASPSVQQERLTRDRSMTTEQAQQRIAAQADMQAKRAAATHVIENDGSRDELVEQVVAFWQEMTGTGANKN